MTFPSKIRTVDKTWVYGHDLETKQPCFQWESPSSPYLKKARQVYLNFKSILNCCLISVGLFIMNLSLRVKLLTGISTKVSYDVYRRLPCSDIKRDGTLVTGYCIMTILILTSLSLYNSIWPHIAWM